MPELPEVETVRRAIAPALASALHAVNDSYRGVLIALGLFGLSAVAVSLHADSVRDRSQ